MIRTGHRGEDVSKLPDLEAQSAIADHWLHSREDHLLQLDQIGGVAIDQERAPRLALDPPTEHLTHFSEHPLGCSCAPSSAPYLSQYLKHMGVAELADWPAHQAPYTISR